MNKRFLVIGLAVFILLLFLLTIIFRSNDDSKPIVSITSNKNISIDTDKDGSPDWLEYLTNSEINNAKSFPYDREIALAKEFQVDDFLFGGPGKFTEDITRRIVLEGDSYISEEEKERFIQESADYFISRANSYELPKINIKIDQNIDKKEFEDNFVLALEEFLKTQESMEKIILEVLQENGSYFSIAKAKRLECAGALKTFPDKSPAEIYEPYYSIVERITYLCTALDLAFSSRNADTLFIVSRLLLEGSFVATVNSLDRPENEILRNLLAFILYSLKQ